MDGEAPVFRISHHLFWTSSQDPGVRLGEMGVRGEKPQPGNGISNLRASQEQTLYAAGQRGLATYYMTLPAWPIYMQVIRCSRCLSAQTSLVPSKGSLQSGAIKKGFSLYEKSWHPARPHTSCLPPYLPVHPHPICSSTIRFGYIYSASLIFH